MLNSNSNTNSLQTQAYTYFINKQYPQALQLYTQALKQPYISSLSQLYLQTTIAIVYIQMNNYTQAHQMLVGLGQRVDIIVKNIRSNTNTNTNTKNRNNKSFTSNTPKSNTDLLTHLLIYLKIEACLLVLQLANCNKNYVHAHLDKIFQIILYGDGFRDRLTLFRSLMLMLVGYGSFQDLYAQAQVKVSTNNYNSKPTMLTSSTTSILLSSLSMTLQLANNPQLAFQVQQKSYQSCKGEQKQQIIPMLISCKHIIHLCDRIKNNSIKNSYIAQFQKLINTPQIYGISQQTLFRGYDDKIQCGKIVVQKIWQFQQNNIKNYYKNQKNGQYTQHMEQDIYLQWLHKRVIYRLEQTLYNLQNKQYQQYQDERSGVNKTVSRESLIRCLNCLNNTKNGIHMLSCMKDSQLVQSVLKQQSVKIQKLFGCIKIIGYGMAWRQLILLPPRPDYQQTEQNNPNEYNYKVFKNVTTRNPTKLQVNQKMQIKEQKYKKQGSNHSPNMSLNMNKNYKLDSRNVYQYQNQQEETEDIPQESTNYRYNNKFMNKKQNSRLDQSPYREVVSSKIRDNQKQRSRYLDVERQRQLERQRESLKQRQIRLKNQELELEKQRKRLQQLKSMQDRQQRQREQLYVDRQQRKIEERDVSQQQRDFSKDQVKYFSNLQRTQRSPRPNRRLQHVNVIKKSPNGRNYKDISPTNSKHQANQNPSEVTIQNSQVNAKRMINNEINTSKIANNMNNVYLDSQSSRYINPLNDLSYQKEIQDTVNLQELNKQRQGKIGLTSKIQRRQNKNVKNPSTNQIINDNVMTILKNQNSRIKNTNQQINKIVNNNSNYNPIIQQQQISKQKDNIREKQRNSFSFNPQNTLNYGHTPSGNQSLNPNSFSPKPNNSIYQDISQINRSQEHAQFNNVDIVIMPAVNPSSISHLSRITTSLNNTNKMDHTLIQDRSILPDNLNRINQNPELKPNTSPINQISNMYSPIKKTQSENQPKILPKLTPQSPYIQKLMKLCNEGQYFDKKNFSSDGGSEKFIQLYGNVLRWAVDEQKISSKYQSYKLKEVKGVIYGKVSDTFLKQCNKKLRPWLCFSLVLKNRTLDFCCRQQIDSFIWLPGLSAAISGQVLDLKYPKRKSKKQEQKVQKVPVTLFTPGKVLWKRILMKLKQLYKKPKKGSAFRNPNAYAIVQWNKQFQKSKSKLQIQQKH